MAAATVAATDASRDRPVPDAPRPHPDGSTAVSDAASLLEAVDDLQSRADLLEAELEHAQRLTSLGTLAAIIAHELNNILTPVLNYAQLSLQASGDDAQRERALHKTVEGVRRASRITEAVLGFARRSDDEPAACDLREVIDETLACLGRDLARDSIELTLDVPPGLRVAMAPTPLQQVLLNLTLNAREAMLGGGGGLTISARRSTWNSADDPDADDGGGVREGVLVEVADTGHGMPPERVETLFTPFASHRRSDAERGRGAHRGVGLGLAVCRQLVESAGGEIACASEVGEGTTFTLRLPTA